MEKLFTYLVIGAVGMAAIKILAYWGIQKIIHSNREPKRLDEASIRISKYFNQMLKSKALRYEDINIIYNILKKYSNGKRYKNNVHLIYSVLKYEPIKRQDLGNIEVYLDTIAKKQKILVNKK